MKKIKIYDLYENLDINTDTIIESLPVIMYFNNYDEELFYGLCMSNKGIIDEELYKVIVKLICLIKTLYLNESKYDVVNLVHQVLSNDILMCYEDKTLIIAYIYRLMNFSFTELFETVNEDAEPFTIEIIKKYVNMFNQISKLPIDTVYDHDYQFISDAFCEELEFLCDTELDEYSSKEDTYMKKMDLFSELVVKTYNLTPDKYRSTILVAERINDINKLSKFMKRMRFIDRNLDIDEYNMILEKYTDEFSSNTLEIIQRELNIDMMIGETYDDYKVVRPDDSDSSGDIAILKKILVRGDND